MYPLFSVLVVCMIGVLMIPNAFAEDWYYYVDPVPSWAPSYTENVVDFSINAWERTNPNLKFIEVTSQERADIVISWVKEFGTGIGGHATYQRFIEVGLGDSNCYNTWYPNSFPYTSRIMTHEIGHTLGLGHEDNIKNIMYPIAQHKAYGTVEFQAKLTANYIGWYPFCPSPDNNTTFEWHVETDDPTYGFDVYVLSSHDEYEKRLQRESFSHYSTDGCYTKQKMLAVGGTCTVDESDSGLMVGMGDKTTNSLTHLTIQYTEKEKPFSPVIPKFTSTPTPQQSKGGGCLIATAAFGSEMAPQVQFLRELRDNTVLQTESGSAFMTGFNQFYYSFSPAIADYERENPAFKEAVKITLTPLLSSLTLLQYADIDSESEMLGYGIGVILLNIGMYFVAPAVLLSVCIRKISKN